MSQKVLIVDDDEPTRAGLAMLVMDAGYRAITASTVPAGIKLLTDERPDLLLVDIRLEEYNATRSPPLSSRGLRIRRSRRMRVVLVRSFSSSRSRLPR